MKKGVHCQLSNGQRQGDREADEETRMGAGHDIAGASLLRMEASMTRKAIAHMHIQISVAAATRNSGLGSLAARSGPQ